MPQMIPFKLHQLVRLLLSAAVLLSSSSSLGLANAQQSLYLKEILTGRCYERTPNPNQCPQIVGSVMGVLDSQSDANIDAMTSFAPYLRQVDMTSPNNRALIWLTGNDGSFAGGNTNNGNGGGYGYGYGGSSNVGGGYSGYGGYSNTQQSSSSSSSSSTNFALHRDMAPMELITPEKTPGGFILQDLVFCGADHKADCNKATSNACKSFWAAAYSQFARSASGRVQIVIEPYADLTFLQTYVISQLNAYQVNEVILYVSNCQDPSYSQLTDAFPITAVQCKDQSSEYAFFMLCQNPSSGACSMLSQVDTSGTISTQQDVAIEQQEEDELLERKNQGGGGGGAGFFFKFVTFVIACYLVYRYMQKPRGPPQYYQYDNVPAAETTSMRI